MGVGATNIDARVAASMGGLSSVSPEFRSSADVPDAGVLFALPALMVCGLLSHTSTYFELPKGYYSLESIFLLLSFIALARIQSIESLRYCSPGEWGNLLGLDRVPEVKTLRKKIAYLSESKQSHQWSSALCKDWLAVMPDEQITLYVDGHVRV